MEPKICATFTGCDTLIISEERQEDRLDARKTYPEAAYVFKELPLMQRDIIDQPMSVLRVAHGVALWLDK